MKVENINGRDYRLPGGLNEFQLQMYVTGLIGNERTSQTSPATTSTKGGKSPMTPSFLKR